jgi:hypothetical protein
MPTPYVQQTWVDGSAGGTPISAARLGVLEQGVQDAQYPVPGYVQLQDEFMGVNTEDGEIGEIGWRIVNSAQGTVSYDPGVTDHMGLINCSATATIGNLTGIATTSSPAGNGFILPAQVDRIIWIVKTVQATSVNYRCGLCQDPTVTAGGTDGAWFDFTAASNTHWRTVTRGTSSNTTNNTTTTVTAGNWYLLDVRRNGSGNWDFYLNTTLQFTHTTNLPAAAVPLIPFAVVEATTATSRQISIDWFGFMSVALGGRFT